MSTLLRKLALEPYRDIKLTEGPHPVSWFFPFCQVAGGRVVDLGYVQLDNYPWSSCALEIGHGCSVSGAPEVTS